MVCEAAAGFLINLLTVTSKKVAVYCWDAQLTAKLINSQWGIYSYWVSWIVYTGRANNRNGPTRHTKL